MDRNPVAAKKAILAAVMCHTFWGLSFMASRTALNTAPVVARAIRETFDQNDIHH